MARQQIESPRYGNFSGGFADKRTKGRRLLLAGCACWPLFCLLPFWITHSHAIFCYLPIPQTINPPTTNMEHIYTGHQQDDSEDLLMRTDNDIIDDVAEEAHHRRSSYHEERRKSDVDRDFDHKPALSREHSDERHHSRHDSEPHPNRGHDRDDKYDVRPTLNSYGSTGDAAARRSRSRSPARETTGGNSVRERRVYVGNLSYDVKWTNLKDFMRESKFACSSYPIAKLVCNSRS